MLPYLHVPKNLELPIQYKILTVPCKKIHNLFEEDENNGTVVLNHQDVTFVRNIAKI